MCVFACRLAMMLIIPISCSWKAVTGIAKGSRGLAGVALLVREAFSCHPCLHVKQDGRIRGADSVNKAGPAHTDKRGHSQID